MARRSSSTSTDIVVGVVRAPHGVRGEVRVEPLSDRSAERLRAGSALLCGDTTLVIATIRGTDADPIVRFEGVDGRDAALRLRGLELRIPREAALRPGEHLWGDLIGMEVVTPDGVRLGEVGEVLRAGGADVLVVHGEREILLPTLESVIKRIDLAARRIVAVPQEEA